MTYVLDGAKMTDKKAMHRELAEKFSFPEWYGENLDALWDMLSEPSEPRTIILHNPELMSDRLREGLLRVLLRVSITDTSTVFSLESDSAVCGRTYSHFTAGEFVVETLALDSRTLDVLVVSREKGNNIAWVRPLEDWCGNEDNKRRYTPVI